MVEEPIAVIGMSCRLPGAASPDGLWELLRAGADAITRIPPGRRPDGTARGWHREGGFLPAVDEFDAGFFGVSPLEAAAMDPQQRLMLELAWEALEEARIRPTSLRGTSAGVFIGAMAADYALLHDRAGVEATSAYALTGVHRSVIANRVSYVLGLHGASMTIDSGQSSSLTAVHLACESLLRGDSRTVLAGGVNLNLVPETTSVVDSFGGLSPDDRCYTFDARANGYVRGEGGALVVLKTLSAALEDGDRIHCLILGGAVNNDGGGEGLAMPRPVAQQEVMERACRRAGVDPAEVQYVELHGTGTRVGDRAEAQALGAAYGSDRPADSPLLVGSVKTNVGHLEGAAGIAGLLKAVLSLKHQQLVPSLNFSSAPAEIPLAELGLSVVDSLRGWPRTDGRLFAGVSSWGMGGSNCHLVLADAPSPEPAAGGQEDASSCPPWVLTAQGAQALRAQAGELARHLAGAPEATAADVALSLVRTRDVFEDRAVLLGTDRDELTAGLRTLAAQGHAESLVVGRARGSDAPVAFVFPGQGSQWPLMARELMDTSPTFALRLAECAEALRPFTSYNLLDVLRRTPGAASLERNDVLQPALWAVMVSLAEVWRGQGVEPGLVIGHSQGEIAAATVIGALSLQDAARVVALRSRVLNRVLGGGMMSIGGASRAVVEELLHPFGTITIAAENGPSSFVVSGAAEELPILMARLEGEGYRAKLVPVEYASHSPAVDAVRAELLDLLAPVRPRSVATPFISTLTGEPMDTAGLDADYWFRSLRQPVRFTDATRRALARDTRVFIECSPHPVLVTAMEETAEESERDIAVIGTLRRDEGGARRVLRSLAEAFVHGAAVEWTSLCDVPGARLVDLPTYAFQRQSYWIGVGRPAAPTAVTPSEQVPEPRPLDGELLAGTPVPTASRRELARLVADLVALVLGHPDGRAIDADGTFKDLGLTSIGAVELRNRLQNATGLRLPTALVYNFPTPRDLADHLYAKLDGDGGAGGPRRDETPSSSAAPGGDEDPVAIVAMSCRYPGDVASPDDLWRLLSEEADAISAFPVNRGWDLDGLLPGDGARAGACTTGHGGFLHDADSFDAAFFGISPREATGMDPQQRLLLETSWEAFERAGLNPRSLRGSDTGVFIGAMAGEYGPRLHEPAGASEGLMLTGNALSVASGRLAYTYGFHGPALTVDTACSSSLVAVQLAVRALRGGECSLALAGGVTVMSNPGNLVEFSRQNGLAPDGRAKAFAADADGTSFAEGAGVLLLSRLSEARRAGYPVLALIRGAAVNQDGASNGLTAPNGEAQQQVIGRALADAGLTARDIDAVEAHGTGTALGDPIEAEALQATYGQGRSPRDPVWLGSVKSNVGHTQAAAGVAGIIKMVLAMRHGVLPRTLHVEEPTPKVDWESGGLRLLTESRAWPGADGPRRAGVSSFGISGTNAHVILESAPHVTRATADTTVEWSTGTALVWPLSARSAASLHGGADRLRRFAEQASYAELAAAASVLAGRAAFEHRAVVVARSQEELTDALGGLAEGRPHPALSTRVADRPAQPVFVFPGRAGDWAGEAAELLRTDERFADAMRRYAQALAPHTGWSVMDVLLAAEGAPRVDTERTARPVWFAVLCALAEVWRSAGIEPAAVLAQGEGEIAAAYVAGALDLTEAARLAALIDPRSGDTVLKPTDVGIWSADTGEPVSGDGRAGGMWGRAATGQDRLDEAILSLAEAYRPLFVELAPQPRLADEIEAVLAVVGVEETTAAVLPPACDASERLAAVAAAYVQGVDVAWHRLLGPSAHHVDLPVYAFDRKRFWLEGPRHARREDSPRPKTPTEPAIPAPAAPEPESAVAASGGVSAVDVSGPLAERLRPLDQDGRREFLVDLVRARVAEVLEHDSPDDVEVARAFNDLGVNSLAAVELEESLNDETGMQLPSTVVFDYPTVQDLAGYLLGRLVVEHATVPAEPAADHPLTLAWNRLLSELSELDVRERDLLVREWRGSLTRLAPLESGAVSGGEPSTSVDDQIFEYIDNQLRA